MINFKQKKYTKVVVLPVLVKTEHYAHSPAFQGLLQTCVIAFIPSLCRRKLTCWQMLIVFDHRDRSFIFCLTYKIVSADSSEFVSSKVWVSTHTRHASRFCFWHRQISLVCTCGFGIWDNLETGQICSFLEEDCLTINAVNELLRGILWTT